MKHSEQIYHFFLIHPAASVYYFNSQKSPQHVLLYLNFNLNMAFLSVFESIIDKEEYKLFEAFSIKI